MDNHSKLNELLDDFFKTFSNNKIIYNTVINNMKTVIINTQHNGDTWILQSSSFEGNESYTDMVKLTGDMVEKITKNKH